MKLTFRLVAFDETANWRDDIVERAGGSIFGVYLYCEGERTYCCSLSPSQWCEFVENHFDLDRVGYAALSDAEADQLNDLTDECGRENGGEVGHYFSFGSHNFTDPRWHSADSKTFTARILDYPGKTWADKRSACRDAMWDQAREMMRENPISNIIPITDDPKVWRDWQREQAKHVIPRLPLFSGRMMT